MADVRILNNIVPEELVEEAKEKYKEYAEGVPEAKRKDLETYIHFYTKIFIAEEELGIKEKFLEVLKKEIASEKRELESSKSYINLKNDSDSEDKNIYSNLVFNDVLEILFNNEFGIEHSSEEQLNFMLQFYFNNIRNVEKECNFLIELENLIKTEEESEEGVPTSLTDFYTMIHKFYYESV